MIIDIHCHMHGDEVLSEYGKQTMTQMAAHGFPGIQNMTRDGTMSDTLLHDMDNANVDRTVILAQDVEVWFQRVGENFYGPIAPYNDYIAHLMTKYPDRFIGFAGIDPRRGRVAISELERCVNELGLKGVKMTPLTGFYPDDPQFYPFYECVEELGVPILYHTGHGPVGTYLKYCRPANVNTVATDFPKITFILAHLSFPWVDEALAAARCTPNIYLDISAWESRYLASPTHLIRALGMAKITCGIEKILFGSDWPLIPPNLSLKDWVDAVNGLRTPDILKQLGIPEITEHDKQLILGDTAAKILGI